LWWPGVRAFIPDSTADDAEGNATEEDSEANTTDLTAAGEASRYQPDSFVFIRDKQYRLAGIPTNGSQVVIDLSKATPGSVAVGDKVCIICAQHPLGALAQVRGIGNVGAL
jgi:hypothetical protein